MDPTDWCIIFLLTAASVGYSDGMLCVKNDRFSHPSGCQYYSECHYGFLVMRECPHGLVYSATNKNCVPKLTKYDDCTPTKGPRTTQPAVSMKETIMSANYDTDDSST